MIQYLYKYRPDDIYTIKLLCEQRLHFSHPYDFNDPFDCKPLTQTDITDEEILAQLDNNCQPWFKELMKDNINILRSMWKSGKVQKTINDSINMHYVCCFSYNADIPAMWAHYAQDHHGLCLGLDSAIDSNFLTGIKGVVRYVDKQPKLTWPKMGTSDHNLKNVLLSKAKEWEYEQEYRVIKHYHQIEHPTDEYDTSFEKEALVAMFFGLRMPEDRQKFYMNLCKLCGFNNVVFHKMTMPTDGTYHLKPQRIEL